MTNFTGVTTFTGRPVQYRLLSVQQLCVATVDFYVSANRQTYAVYVMATYYLQHSTEKNLKPVKTSEKEIWATLTLLSTSFELNSRDDAGLVSGFNLDPLSKFFGTF